MQRLSSEPRGRDRRNQPRFDARVENRIEIASESFDNSGNSFRHWLALAPRGSEGMAILVLIVSLTDIGIWLRMDALVSNHPL